jgi:hypothetical protein
VPEITSLSYSLDNHKSDILKLIMSRDYDHGVGTGQNDEIHEYRGQARMSFWKWVGSLFGGSVPPGQRYPDGRTVKYEDPKRGITLTVRSDRDGNDKMEVRGSIDCKSKVRTPSGIVQSETKHFGYKKD